MERPARKLVLQPTTGRTHSRNLLITNTCCRTQQRFDSLTNRSFSPWLPHVQLHAVYRCLLSPNIVVSGIGSAARAKACLHLQTVQQNSKQISALSEVRLKMFRGEKLLRCMQTSRSLQRLSCRLWKGVFICQHRL